MTSYKLSLFAFLCSATCLLAAPPSNDNKANAQVLTGDTASVTTSNVEATKETGESAERTLWWRWTAPANGRLLLDCVGSAATYLKIDVFLSDGSGNTTGFIAGTNTSGSSTPSLSPAVSAGTTYFIRTGSSSTGLARTGSVLLGLSLNRGSVIGTLPIAHAATIANDSFAQRITLSGNVVAALGYTGSATNEAGEPSSSGYRTLWWQYRPSQNGRLTISSTNSDHDYPKIAAYLGSTINNLRIVRAHGALSGASVSFPVTGGVDYMISYGTTSSSEYGTAVLNLSLSTQTDVSSLLTPPATMANDSYAQRVTLTGDTVGAIAYNASATTETGEPSLAGLQTFWWVYRPSANGILNITTAGSDITYPVISVYLGPSLSELKAVTYSASFDGAATSLPVTAGAEYLIAFGTTSSFSSSSGSLVLGVSLNKNTPMNALYTPVPATMQNDAFANRVQLTGRNVSAIGYTLGATREAQEPDTGYRTVWFSWTANASGQAFVDFTGTSLSGLSGDVLTGNSLGALTAVPLIPGGANQVQFTAISGTVYHLALGELNENAWRSLVVTFIGPESVPVAPTFTQHPVSGSGWYRVGQTLQLSATTDDTSAVYQWRQNAKSITRATLASLSLPITAVTQAGLYDVTSKNSVGTATSNDALIGILANLAPSLNVAEGGTLKLSVLAQAPSTISYRWHKEGAPIADGTLGKIITKGSGTAALSIAGITLDQAGGYTCELKMANPVNLASPFVAVSSTCSVGVVLKPVVDDLAVPPAAVSRSFSWQLTASEAPTGFIVSGLPSGLIVNTTTGLITGIPNAVGQPKIKVSAKNVAGTGAIKEFTLNITALPDGVAGVFSGLLPRQNDLNSNLGGWFTVTVGSTGSFTGSVKNGLLTYAIKGRLDAPLSAAPSAVVPIPRTAPLPPLNLTLTFTGSLNSVSATLSNGSASAAGEGRRHIWTSTSATAYAAAYNSVVELPLASMNDTAQPLGSGWQQMTISKSGVVSGTGRTADGMSYTFSGTLWPNGSLPQFAILYTSKTGSITGLPRVSLGADLAANRVSGWVEQIKNGPASSTDRTYRNSIPLLRRDVDGAPWVKPTTLMPVVMELPDAPDNADIAFTNGGIESAAQFSDLDQVFRINKTNTTSFKTITGGNPSAVTMKITATTGLFTGSFTLTDTVSGLVVKRPVSFSGIMLSHRGLGFGYFTLNGLSPSSATAPILSGRVLLD